MNPFEGLFKEDDGEKMYELGLYQSYCTVAPSLRETSDCSNLCYNEDTEELNYIDKAGQSFIVKLFTRSKERLL